MKTLRLSRRQRALANCAPVSEERIRDRSMRAAVSRARGSDEFTNQQGFDRAVAALVRAIPMPPEAGEFFSGKNLSPPSKKTGKKPARNPVVPELGISFLVIGGVFAF